MMHLGRLAEIDPFTTSIDIEKIESVIDQMVRVMKKPENLQIETGIMLYMITELSKCGVADEASLLSHLKNEIELYKKFIKYRLQDEPMILLSPINWAENIVEVTEACKKYPLAFIKKGDWNDTFQAYPYGFLDFISESLINFLWGEVHVYLNKDRAKTCIESMGFKDVNVTKKKSPINGRSNVWLIEGKYKGGR